jgi:hypothetical protein
MFATHELETIKTALTNEALSKVETVGSESALPYVALPKKVDVMIDNIKREIKYEALATQCIFEQTTD